MFNRGLEANITPYARLFSSFINTGRRVLLAHNKYVSVYNLSKEKWTKRHFKFEYNIRQIFRNRKVQAEKSELQDEEENFDIGVLVGDN